MGDDNPRGARRLQSLAHIDSESLAQFRIQCAEGLVEEDDSWSRREGSRERDALSLATRELRDLPMLEPRKADKVQDLGNALLACRPGRPTHLETEADISAYVAMRKELTVLKHDADVPFVRGDRVQVTTTRTQYAFLRDQSRDGQQQRRLPAP